MTVAMLLYIACCCLLYDIVWARDPDTDLPWMIFPAEDGTLRLVILKGLVTVSDELSVDGQVSFHLYTRCNPEKRTQIYLNDTQVASLDLSKPTKIIIHGFTASAFSDWNFDLKDNFLLSEDCNVILVDWSGPAFGPLYNIARANVKPTGEYVARMLDFMSSLGLDLATVHCIGHSLGAHVCGFAGKSLRGSLGRISGLDPALPLFKEENPEDRLAITDAVYVDVIHTCGGWLGFAHPIGHADFYPNGGDEQPGCGFDIFGLCSHSRSHEYFAESIVSLKFVATACESWDNFQNNSCSDGERALMGYPACPSDRDTYYLVTAHEPPFALG